MAISSINFQKTKSNSVAETTRQFEAKYLLKKKYRKENEYWNCGVDERELFAQELAKSERRGGRVPKVENSLWEGVLNLNENHTMEDVKKVAEHIAKRFNVHSTRIAIHRDEGHFDIVSGKVEYNYHAHLNFMSWKDGRQNWRRELIGKKALSELQTEIAEILNMERGQENSESIRANHRHFRENAEKIKAERKAVRELAKLKDLKPEISRLREQLKEQGANREEYAKLEALTKKMRSAIKSKNLTIAELQEEIAEYEAKKPSFFRDAFSGRKENAKLKSENTKLRKENDTMKSENRRLKRKVNGVLKKFREYRTKNPEATKADIEMKKMISNLFTLFNVKKENYQELYKKANEANYDYQFVLSEYQKTKKQLEKAQELNPEYRQSAELERMKTENATLRKELEIERYERQQERKPKKKQEQDIGYMPSM